MTLLLWMVIDVSARVFASLFEFRMPPYSLVSDSILLGTGARQLGGLVLLGDFILDRVVASVQVGLIRHQLEQVELRLDGLIDLLGRIEQGGDDLADLVVIEFELRQLRLNLLLEERFDLVGRQTL